MKLNINEINRLDAGIELLKIVSDETSVVSKAIKITHAKNVPNNAASAIGRIIKSEPCHEVYGSLAAKANSLNARIPGDIDVVVRNPRMTASRINQVLTNHGHKTKTTCNPMFGSCAVQIMKGNELIDVVDIHPSNQHYGKFKAGKTPIGSSKKPRHRDGFNIQTAHDQLLRKAQSVMSFETGTRMGPPDHRRLKDVEDFITGSRLMLDSKQLRAEAELKKVEKGRKKLKKWKKHIKTLDGYNPRTTRVGKDPIPEYKEQEFIRFAVNNPHIDTDEIVFKKGGVGKRTVNKDMLFCPFDQFNEGVKDPYAGGPHTKSPYVKNPYKKRQRKSGVGRLLVGDERCDQLQNFGGVSNLLKYF